jgi:hypothetical protein
MHARNQYVRNVCCRLNRKVKYHLDNDLADKFVALGVDTHNTGLHPGSKGTEYHAGKARISGKLDELIFV